MLNLPTLYGTYPHYPARFTPFGTARFNPIDPKRNVKVLVKITKTVAYTQRIAYLCSVLKNQANENFI